MIVIIRTCYNLFYNSDSLAINQIALERNFLWRGAQIIGSEIIQTDNKVFSEIEGTFSELHLGYTHENISNLKNIFWDSMRHTEDPGT